MGSAIRYVCPTCGHVTRPVTPDFDSGFFTVTTPIVCPEQGGAGEGQTDVTTSSGVSLPHLRKDWLLWDHDTCPKCGTRGMGVDPHGMLLWD